MSAKEDAPHIEMSWDDVNVAVAHILGQFKEDGYEPSQIIAVAKGGVVPATLIHQAFPDAHFDTIYVRSYDHFFAREPHIIGKVPAAPAWPQTLIVDDILETGGTMRFLQRHYPKATYAFMVCRQSMAGECKYRGKIMGPGWIDFPWERKVAPIDIPF